MDRSWQLQGFLKKLRLYWYNPNYKAFNCRCSSTNRQQNWPALQYLKCSLASLKALQSNWAPPIAIEITSSNVKLVVPLSKI